METVIPIAVHAPGEEKRCLTSKTSGRMITLRFDDIVEKLKQMEEQESGEAWVEDEEEWEKAGKAKSLATAGKHLENTTEGQTSSQQGVEEDEDVDEECEPGLTPRPGEGSQIDDPELARAKRRMNVLVEIVETEKDYYRDLEILNNLYLQPLRKGRILPDTELGLIFSTLPTLLSINKSLLDALQVRVNACQGLPDEDVCMGDLFLEHTDYLKLYGTFCSRQAEALRAIRRNKATNATFQTFILKAQNKPQCRKLDLKSFLIKPVQRICQYPLLLQELLKHTPDAHKDRASVELALEKLLAIAEHVNDATERAYSIAKIIELRHTIQGLQNLELINPKRSFVGEAAFTELNKKRQVDKTLQLFLFSDCLLVCEPLKGAAAKIQHANKTAATARASVRLQGPLYAFKQYFLLHEVVFKDISDSSLPLLQMVSAGKGKVGKTKERDRAYTYDLANSSSYRTLCAGSLKDKARWIDIWGKVKREHDERKKQRSKIVYEAAKKKGMGDLGNGETACLDNFTPFGCASPTIAQTRQHVLHRRPPPSPSPSAAGSPLPCRSAVPPSPGSPLAASVSASSPVASPLASARYPQSSSSSSSAPTSRFIPATPSNSAPASPLPSMSPTREKLSKLRDVIIKRKDMLMRSKGKEESSESDGDDDNGDDGAHHASLIIGEARDVPTATVAATVSRSTIVVGRVDPRVAPEPQRARATSKPTPPLPPPRRVLSSDNEAPSRPAIPPLPLLLRDHPAWQAREEAKAKTRSTPGPACETSPRTERPPVPPFPAYLHNNNNNDINEGESASTKVQQKVTTAAAVSAIAAPMSPPPPARPPRPTRLQATAKQRSYYPTSHRDRQLEVSEQLARWNQFYNSTSRKVRDNNTEEGDDDDDDDSAVSSPGTRGVASPKPPSTRPPPVPPARQTVGVPSPTSCPAAIQSSTPSPSSSTSSSPTGSGSHPLRDLQKPEDAETTSTP